MVYLHTAFYYIDIGIEIWDMRKRLGCISLDTLYEDLPPISRYPDEMVHCFIDGMGPLSISHAPSYQIPSRLDSCYITRQESGVLCGSISHFFFSLRSTRESLPRTRSLLQLMQHVAGSFVPEITGLLKIRNSRPVLTGSSIERSAIIVRRGIDRPQKDSCIKIF
jgi:hypothetical protein